ncbi:GerAB/ArcD/ProY family transporter [Pseudalkalibacillus sp. Hm43]|uniref:GerAB/ArcD/ProY family transporter n=1 Tax=Pseudalkalibacillus sp. Hm43 TaxID=3450742 RepID=UPI003F42B581
MKNKSESITKYQLLFMILQTQIGVGVLGLPYSVHKVSKSDGWISVILAGLIVQLMILVIWALVRKYPGETIYGIAEQVTGKFFGKIIAGLYILYATIISTLILILFQDILKLWVLPNTPKSVIMFLMLFASLYLVKERIRVIARFYLFVTSMVPVLIILTFISFPDVAEYRYLFPIGQAGALKILVGAHSVLISMLGFEMLLLLFKYVDANDRSIIKSVSIANGITTVIYVFLTIISYVVFSPKEIEIVPQPVLYMLKAITFKIVERIDLLFLSIWIVIVTTSLMSYLLFASKGLSHFMKKEEHKKAAYVLAIPIYLLALIPQDKFQIEQISTYIGYASYLFIAIFPIVLWILSRMTSSNSKRR